VNAAAQSWREKAPTKAEALRKLLSDFRWHDHHAMMAAGGSRFGGRLHELRRAGLRVKSRPGSSDREWDYRELAPWEPDDDSVGDPSAVRATTTQLPAAPKVVAAPTLRAVPSAPPGVRSADGATPSASFSCPCGRASAVNHCSRCGPFCGAFGHFPHVCPDESAP
jgi:hypothetical protein